MVSWDFNVDFNVVSRDFHWNSWDCNVDLMWFHGISIGIHGILGCTLMWIHRISIGIHGISMWILKGLMRFLSEFMGF